MLSIGKLGAGQHRYYLDKVAEGAEDYYSGEGEAEGYWLGDAARDLGLEGKVDADQLVAMLTGNNPVSGEPLGLKSAPNREPVPGFDLTFSAPKSVSLTWALGGHPVSSQVAEAHRAAVAEALGYLERQACWTRRGKGGHEFVRGNGFLAAAYAHRSSRAGDPQLHTHVLIANATKGPDGRWSRLYHPAIYEHAKTASYIYEAHLRHELTQRLGVEWQPVVAASRSREETYFYVTPDRELERMEFAPGSLDVGDGLEQIARAAERDGSQAAAHDEALRAKLSPLSAEELHARHRELASEVRAEADNQRAWGSLEKRTAENESRLDAIAESYANLGEPPSRFARREVRSEYNREVALLRALEAAAYEEAAKLETKRAELAPTEHAARAEAAVIEHLAAECQRARLEVVRLNPPDYITKELGPRPSDPAKRQHWDKAVGGIEGYRQQHGIGDRDNALGGNPKDRSAELAQQQARLSLQRSQRSLQIRQARTIEQSRGIEL